MTSDNKNNPHDEYIADDTLADEPGQASDLALEEEVIEAELDVPEIMVHLDDFPEDDLVDGDLEADELQEGPEDDLEGTFEEFPDEESWDEDQEPASYDEQLYDEFDEPAKKVRSKKALAPALLLVAAAGVGAYLVLSPPPSNQGQAPADYVAPSVDMAAQKTDELIPLEIPDFGAATEGLPQPVANINEIPRPPGEDDFLSGIEMEVPHEVEVYADVLPAEEELQDVDVAASISNVVAIEEGIAIDSESELETADQFTSQDITEPPSEMANSFVEVPDLTDGFSISPDAAEPEDVASFSESEFATENPASLEEGPQSLQETEVSESNYIDTAAVPVKEPAVNDVSFPNIPVSPETPYQAEQIEQAATLAEKDVAPFPDINAEQVTGNQVVAQATPVTAEVRQGESLAAPEVSRSPVPGREVVQPDAYFDSRLNVPQGNVASLTNLPRKVDPTQEPGSKLVVVSKTHSPDDFESLVVAAGRALKLERYRAASEMYDSLYKLNPRDPRVLMGQAVAYQKLGRAEAALQGYEKLLEIQPDNADALVNMLGILRQEYPEVALRRLKLLLEKHPGKASISAQLGIMEADSRNFGDALHYLNMAASIEPRNAQHFFNMGVIADRARQRDNAITYYQQALEVDSVYGGGQSIPRSQVYDRLAILRSRSQ